MIHGRWFDGKTSQAQPVLVAVEAGHDGPVLRLQLANDAGPSRQFTGDEIGWPERWSTRRSAADRVIIDLRQHGSVEVDDAAAWQAARDAAGVRASLAEKMQTRWHVFAAVLLLAVAGLGAFYRWGTPWAATQITRQVPLEWEIALTQRALQDIDGQLLKPSKLPAQRQAELRERFNALTRQIEPGLRRYPGYAPRLSFTFRSGLGANALALPGGTIIMTDGMVEAAARQGLGDDALVGVMAHEIGHVLHRHTTRMIVEQAVLNVGLGLALGDMSMLVSMGGSLLTGMAYQRGHETEADCFAVALMRKAKLPTEPMADLLLGLEKGPDKKSQGPASQDSALGDLLSSHPATEQRARQMKQGNPQGCRLPA